MCVEALPKCWGPCCAVLTSVNLYDSPPKKHYYYLGFIEEKLRHRLVRDSTRVTEGVKGGAGIQTHICLSAEPVLEISALTASWVQSKEVICGYGGNQCGFPWSVSGISEGHSCSPSSPGLPWEL